MKIKIIILFWCDHPLHLKLNLTPHTIFTGFLTHIKVQICCRRQLSPHWRQLFKTHQPAGTNHKPSRWTTVQVSEVPESFLHIMHIQSLHFVGKSFFFLWIKLWNLLLFCPLCVVCSTYWFSDLTKELVTANFVANFGLLISAANCLLWLETRLMAAGRLNCPTAAEIKKMLNCCIHQ